LTDQVLQPSDSFLNRHAHNLQQRTPCNGSTDQQTQVDCTDYAQLSCSPEATRQVSHPGVSSTVSGYSCELHCRTFLLLHSMSLSCSCKQRQQLHCSFLLSLHSSCRSLPCMVHQTLCAVKVQRTFSTQAGSNMLCSSTVLQCLGSPPQPLSCKHPLLLPTCRSSAGQNDGSLRCCSAICMCCSSSCARLLRLWTCCSCC
jgi:hypothetical protein